jgi:hypothetical protein
MLYHSPEKTMFDVQKGVSPNVLKVKLDCRKRKEHWFLLRSDAHHDNPHASWDLEKKHLDEALERDAGILDCGDLFCAMQGAFDKRSNKSTLRPEHQNGEYFDALVKTAADFYQPYAKNWISFGLGNHETSILKRHETNLTERLAQTLRDRTGAPCFVTGYTGWVKFQFMGGKDTMTTRTLWHMHGYGGGGPVTADNIQAQRQNAYIEGADIMWSGHVHERWAREFIKVGIDQEGEVKHRSSWYIKSPTYKDEYGSGTGGWHIETGKPPKPLGAWWLKMTYSRREVNKVRRCEVVIDVIPAS